MTHKCGHDHELYGNTDCSWGHFHKIKDEETRDTQYFGNGYDHVHTFKGQTTKDNGHRHSYCYYTGPAIPAACGHGHYHYFYGITSFEDGHTHYYRGITDIENEY